jgi:polysaccharide export outer membrane protein
MKHVLQLLLLIPSLILGQSLPASINLPTDSQSSKTVAQATYTLGAGDTVTVSVSGLDDFFNDKTFLIDMDGNITLPLAGSLKASGLTIHQLQIETAEHLTNIVKDPDVVISLGAYGSQPVSILGAVASPGMRQLEGKRTLYEVLSLAGGLRPDAGSSVHITRDLKWGRIPLPDAKDDTTGRFSLASVNVKSIMTGNNPAENIAIKPNDVISVPKAEMVFAVGSVAKPGGFLLSENETMSTLQVISLSGGLQKTAAADKAKILRAIAGSSNRLEIPVDVKRLMAGKMADIPLQSNDILFIPGSNAKAAGYRTLDVVTAAAGFAVARY